MDLLLNRGRESKESRMTPSYFKNLGKERLLVPLTEIGETMRKNGTGEDIRSSVWVALSLRGT